MYISSIDDLLQLNLLPLAAIIFTGFFLSVNKKYEPTLTSFFQPMYIFLVVLLITDNIDYKLYDFDMPTIHSVVTIVGYIMRILILLRITTIMEYNVFGASHKWLVIPAVLDFGILTLSFSTHLVFWYGADRMFNRGPLGFSTHMTMMVYIAYAIYLAIKSIIKGHKSEGFLIIIMLSLCVFTVFAELKFKYKLRGTLPGVIALCISFYYLYLHIVRFYTDPLTGALNRASFYADMKTYGQSITAIYSIDLNGLKQANDTQGHQAGDKLLKDSSAKMKDALLPGCHLYRTGGDEFVIMCVKLSRSEVQRMTGRLFDCQRSGCDFAFGMSEFVDSPSQTFRIADDAMYENKRSMKSVRKAEHAV